MKDNELIVCRDVSLGYEGRSVLSGLNLTISKGDYLCVVGDNGSGKSTLMRGLLGLLQPQIGHIEHAPALRHGAIGYLPQQTRAQRDFPATVLEVVLSGCLNRRGLHFLYTPAQRSEAMMNLGKLGILELKDACYRDLSGGQQQPQRQNGFHGNTLPFCIVVASVYRFSGKIARTAVSFPYLAQHQSVPPRHKVARLPQRVPAGSAAGQCRPPADEAGL